ncbi:FtsX-like permease family protein [Micromonosporaceae bacterium Da 78-11]
MRAGLTRQALKANPWSFFGPVSTQCLAAVIITGALGAQRSLDVAALSRAERLALDDSGIPEIAIIFLMIAIYLSAIVVGVTMGATIARQARDIALVRAIGATPRQVRFSIAGQAMLVAVPATLLGVPLGQFGGRAWVDGLVGHGVIPDRITFDAHPRALPVALAVTVGTSLLGALIAAIRPSRVRPAVALTETVAPRRRIGPVRTVLGLLLVVAGVVLSVRIAGLDAQTADDAGFFVMLAMCVGAGLLGPALLRVFAPLARLAGPLGRLAADNVAVRAKAYSGALVPLTLAIAFAAVKVLARTTSTHVTGLASSPADVWIDVTGTSVYAGFAAVAALNTLITVVVSRRRDLAVAQLAGGTRRQVLAVVICEALVVTVTGLLVAAVVAGTAMVPILHAAFGTWLPWLPASYLVTGVLGVAALVLAGTVVPAAVAMRRPAVEVVG